jgi:ATP-dependent helicase YprA (DUF1998 family)
MGLDEMHLYDETDSVFIEPYGGVPNYRYLAPSTTTWVGASGTISPSRALIIASGLGFFGDYVHATYSVDRPNVKYITRFFEHPYTGSVRHDFDKFIPFKANSVDDIKRTIIFLDHYDEAYSLMLHLESLLSWQLPERSDIIKLYSGLFDIDYRRKTLRDVSDGRTRVLIVTDTCTYGLDIPSLEVVVIGTMCLSPENLKQKMGRPGRDGKPAVAFI